MLKFNFGFMKMLIMALASGCLLMSVWSYFFCSKEIIYLEISWSMWGEVFKGLVLFDKVSVLFGNSVLLITLSVMCFSKSYMMSDRYYQVFHILVLIFVLSMCLLIFSPNLFSGMLGWDGLGLSSYLLVIYYNNSKAFNSGLITALSNRIGDALLLMSIGGTSYYGDWSLSFYSSLTEDSAMFLVLIILAATTKSAQVPFCAWLPAAMAAPTPVSSLVHSSTLVTAGVYLIIRHQELFTSMGLNKYLLLVGSLTLLVSSFSALFESDMKKMVALSTLSQLSVMVVALGSGSCVLSFFHLLSHAFFKALLFISVGSLIHSSNSFQDMRVMGGKSMAKPVSSCFMVISMFSLCGLPYMSAFFSKEMILEWLILSNSSIISVSYLFLGACLTLVYSARLLLLVMASFSRGQSLSLSEDQDLETSKSMMVLGGPAAIGGWALSNYIFPVSIVGSSSCEFKLTLLFLLFSLFIYMVSLIKKSSTSVWGKVSWGMGMMWMMPFFSAQIPVEKFSLKGIYYLKFMDRGAVKFFTLELSSNFSKNMGAMVSAPQVQLKLMGALVIWGLVLSMIFY